MERNKGSVFYGGILGKTNLKGSAVATRGEWL